MFFIETRVLKYFSLTTIVLDNVQTVNYEICTQPSKHSISVTGDVTHYLRSVIRDWHEARTKEECTKADAIYNDVGTTSLLFIPCLIIVIS